MDRQLKRIALDLEDLADDVNIGFKIKEKIKEVIRAINIIDMYSNNDDNY